MKISKKNSEYQVPQAPKFQYVPEQKPTRIYTRTYFDSDTSTTLHCTSSQAETLSCKHLWSVGRIQARADPKG